MPNYNFDLIELPVGSIVFDNLLTKVVELNLTNLLFLQFEHDKFSLRFSPILLTEHIMDSLRCENGIHKTPFLHKSERFDNCHHYKIGGYVEVLTYSGKLHQMVDVRHRHETLNEVMYLHQLQSFVFMVTGYKLDASKLLENDTKE
ncbi:MAG: hypothetical protein VKL39_21730 [Leptolyngbyaceae bacterium]|nr:hypothetical protein [Leptolyngbyaceae bacterium]